MGAIIESTMECGTCANKSIAEPTSFGEVIRQYMKEITPGKRGWHEEKIRLTATLRLKVSEFSVANLTPVVLANYRDDRLKSCQPSTVVRDLATLIFDHQSRQA